MMHLGRGKPDSEKDCRDRRPQDCDSLTPKKYSKNDKNWQKTGKKSEIYASKTIKNSKKRQKTGKSMTKRRLKHHLSPKFDSDASHAHPRIKKHDDERHPDTRCPPPRHPHRITDATQSSLHHTTHATRHTTWATGLTPRRPYRPDAGPEQMRLLADPADDDHYPPLPIIFMGRMSIMTIAPSPSLITFIVH